MADLACRDRQGTNTGYRRHMVAMSEARARGDVVPETCRPCKDARAAWQRGYAARRYLARGALSVDAAGTQRRLRALAAIGWSFVELGHRLGMGGCVVSRIAVANSRVLLATAEKVSALYDELSMIPGGNKTVVTRARMKGWAPPLAWDDDSIDDPSAKAQGVAA